MSLHNYYPKPKYLIIGSFGPLGFVTVFFAGPDHRADPATRTSRNRMTSAT